MIGSTSPAVTYLFFVSGLGMNGDTRSAVRHSCLPLRNWARADVVLTVSRAVRLRTASQHGAMLIKDIIVVYKSLKEIASRLLFQQLVFWLKLKSQLDSTSYTYIIVDGLPVAVALLSVSSVFGCDYRLL